MGFIYTFEKLWIFIYNFSYFLLFYYFLLFIFHWDDDFCYIIEMLEMNCMRETLIILKD